MLSQPAAQVARSLINETTSKRLAGVGVAKLTSVIRCASCSETRSIPSGRREDMSWRPILNPRALAGAMFALALGAGGATGAQAAFPNQLPFMCFNTARTFHQTFGPDSFFLNENQQGPTSFHENPPRSNRP